MKPFRATSHCGICHITATWEGKASQSRSESACTDHPSSFVCDHWRDHHDAVSFAEDSPNGKAEEGPVSAELTWL